jgi:hypothetical protein
MAEVPVTTVETAGIYLQPPLHARHQFGLWSFHYQVEVIALRP